MTAAIFAVRSERIVMEPSPWRARLASLAA
jgi:hypothetical protein